MDEISSLHFDNPRGDGAFRNTSSAPALMSISVLESVLEEDENSAHREHSDKSAERGTPIDVEINMSLKTLGFTKTSVQDPGFIKTNSSKSPEHHREESSHKPLNKEGIKKKRHSKQDNGIHLDQKTESESDMEDFHQHDSHSDSEILNVDIAHEKEWDTDLETEEPQVTYDHSGKTAYIEACRKFEVIPTAYFLRHMNNNQLSMKHHGLTGADMKAIAASLASNTTIIMLDLSDNWLGHDGGLAVCEALKENCFITDLNLSDNHLNLCAEQLCHIIQQNSTLCRVNLSGNSFDDQCATYVADLILYTTKLEFLSLSHNRFGEKAGLLLGSAISENLCLKELDLSWNHLRRKGAMAIAAGIKNNVYMKKINLAWNGFGLEGSVGLMDALRTNSVLEELDITNNRITTEGAILIGKGLTANETLKILKIGKNPIQSAGCWGIVAAILRNPNCILKTLDFTDIQVNNDFTDLRKKTEDQFPNLVMTHGGVEHQVKDLHPRDKMITYMSKHNIKLADFFSHLNGDTTMTVDNNMTVTRDEFKQGIQNARISLTEKEVDILLDELDVHGSGEIKYSIPPNQTAVEDGAPGAPIEFTISGNSEEYLDLYNTYLHIRVKVTLPNGDVLPAEVYVAPVNYYLHALFSQVDVALNDTLITPSENTYPYRAYIEATLNYGDEAKKGHLSAGGYYRDTHFYLDDTQSDNNKGLQYRKGIASNSQELDLMGRFHSDIFAQDRYMLNGVDVKIRLTPSKDSFNLIANDPTVGYKSIITYASLVVRKAKLNPAISLAQEKALTKGNAKYPVKRVVLKTVSVPKGMLSHTQDNLFLSQTPT